MTHHSLIPHTRPSQRGPMLRWLGRMAFVLAVLLSVVLAGVLIAANATLSRVEAATVQAVPVRFDGRALAAISEFLSAE